MSSLKRLESSAIFNAPDVLLITLCTIISSSGAKWLLSTSHNTFCLSETVLAMLDDDVIQTETVS